MLSGMLLAVVLVSVEGRAGGAGADLDLRAPTVPAQVAAALRREAAARTAGERDAALREILELRKRVAAGEGVSPTQARGLERTIRQRLTHVARQAAVSRRAATTTPRGPAVLAQVPPGGNAPNVGPPPIGEDLVTLIEETIAPASWQIRGGNGVIVFWSRTNALVVRQTGDGHHDLAGLIRDLHGE